MARESTPQRRPGRLRRWVLRPAVWGSLLFLLLVLGALLSLETPPVERAIRTRLEALAGERLGREVRIGGLDIDLLPLGIEATGLWVASDQPGTPLATAEALRVDASLTDLFEPRLTLHRIEVDSPRFHLALYADGGTNLPALPERGDGERPLEIEVGTLVVDDGVLFVDKADVPFSLRAEGIEARAVPGRERLLAHLTGQRVEVALPGAEPYAAGLAAQLAVGDGFAELISARVRGPELAAQATGELTWGEHRELSIDVEVDADAALFDRLGYTEGQVVGELSWNGNFGWRPEVWGFRGRLSSPRLVLEGRRIERFAGMLAGDENGVWLEIGQASYADGSLHGSLRVDLSGEARTTELDLTFARLRLATLLDDQGLPIEGVAGRLNGVFFYRFTPADPRRGDGWGEIGITSVAAPGRRLALTGTVPMVLEDGVVRTRAVRATSGDLSLVASGSYDLDAGIGTYEFTVETESVERLGWLLPDEITEPAPAWLPTAGRGRIDGRLWLAPEETAPDGVGLRSTLELDLRGVEAPGVRAEELTGSVTATPLGLESLRLELVRDDAALLVTGAIPFAEEGAPGEAEGAPAAPLSLTVDAVRWPLADAAPWLPFAVPAEGPASGTVVLAGPPDALGGRVAMTVEPASLLGVEVASVSLRLAFDPQRAVVERLVARDAAGEVRVSGELPLTGPGIDLEIASEPLELAASPFAELAAGDLSGRLVIDGRLSGSLEEPELALELAGRELSLAGRALGEEGTAELAIFWDGHEARVDGSLLGLVEVAGGGPFDLEGYDLSLTVASDGLGRLLAAVAGESLPAVEGRFRGELRLAAGASGESPEEEVVQRTHLELAELRVAYGGHSFDNLEPVVIRLEEGRVVIDSLFLGEEGTTSDLFVGGSVELADDPRLDLRVQSSLEASWAELVLPGVEVEGRIDLLATVRGTAERPALNGQAELAEGRLVFADFPQPVDRFSALVLLYPRQVVIDSARGRFAGGELRASGNLVPYGPLGQPPQADAALSYRLQLSAEGLRLRYPEGWLMEGGAELQLLSTPDGRELRGAVSLEQALYYQPVELGVVTLLQQFLRRQRVEVEETDELLASTQLNLAVEGADALRVRNNLADLTGDIDLTVRGSLASPVLFGRVEVGRAGTLVYADTEYQVERAIVTFANPYRLEPVIDLVATSRIDQYDVTLNLSGTLDRLNATFASDPPLPDLDVLALVTTGRTTGRGPGLAEPATGSAFSAEGFLYGQAASVISSRVNTLFGLDRFRIDPLTGESGGPSSARITLGKRLSRDLVATYSYDPTETEQQILQVEWQVHRGFALVVTQNGDGSYAVDGRWERSF